MTFEGGIYVQKRGICIGASVAPVLCNIFLGMCGKAISEKLMKSDGKYKVFRYVDDFLILAPTSGPSSCEVTEVLKVFKSCCYGLSFTHEIPKDGIMQFLDFKLSFLGEHTCWTYAPRSKKGILPYDSCHSNLVKRGIASSCLEASLKKSCPHSAQDSFVRQVDRLQRGDSQ